MDYKKLIEKRNKPGDFATDIGVKILEIREGYACGELLIKKVHINPINAVHGGVIFTFADMVGASSTAFCENRVATLNGTINFLNAAIGVEKLIAEASVIKHGKNTMVVNVNITDEKETFIASTTFTYYILKKMKITFEDEN
ncbi:PaaI family thioesterase [Clostridium kluyveri]|uniref:Thioesterase n=1 Tax=Clostridium kluyveri TaxID=1534 RepID=A0A1L5F4G8_CLOKL|nr:PaaI family thioesterase [Clostridium kluyveri]APM37906.1 thioesterase [Clostridium kluyveri]UZQ52089.1 PaaI family thioesterase [Clostridium kluyveri]